MKVNELFEEKSALQRIKGALMVRHAEVVEVDDESDQLSISMQYEFPEHAPTLKELKSVLKPEFSKVQRERSDIDPSGFVYYFTRVQ